LSKSKRVILLKFALLCGMITPIISLSFITVAIAYTPQFNWFTWALSDLGVHQAAFIFNSGLIIGGILATMFAVGLMQILRKKILGFLGTFTLVLSSINLCAVGVFPESAGRIHFYVSLAFFVLLAISLLFIGASLIRESSQRYLGLFTILTVVAGSVAALAVPHEGMAIPEMIGALAGSVWAVVLSVTFLETTYT